MDGIPLRHDRDFRFLTAADRAIPHDRAAASVPGVVGASPEEHETTYSETGAETGADVPAETAAEAVAGIDGQLDGELDGAELIANARRRHGATGAIVAAGMFGLDQALSGRKVKQEAPIVVSAPTEPVDIDTAGIALTVDDETSVVAPALPRVAPRVASRRRTRR